jgi:hypothetical protein
MLFILPVFVDVGRKLECCSLSPFIIWWSSCSHGYIDTTMAAQDARPADELNIGTQVHDK